MTLNEYFDKIYCINLDRRTDRWEASIKEFKKHGLNVHRFSAIDGSQTSFNGTSLLPGEAGCSMSHAKVLRDMIENNYQRILILEDDVEFMEGLQSYFNECYFVMPENWNMLYLGGNHINPPQPINQYFAKISRTYTTSHYGITLNMAKAVVEQIEALNCQVDVAYSRYHQGGSCYTFHPGIARQTPGFSDIQNGHTDYVCYMNFKGL